MTHYGFGSRSGIWQHGSLIGGPDMRLLLSNMGLRNRFANVKKNEAILKTSDGFNSSKNTMSEDLPVPMLISTAFAGLLRP